MSLWAMPNNLVLAASAGTGKTHALVGVVVHLVICDRAEGKKRSEPAEPARIVATTFSRKAAAEIRARVTEELDRLGSSPETSTYVASLRATQVERGGRALTDAEIGRRARRALAGLPRARFGTIHSFATGIVREHAIEIGTGPGFELATEADARARSEDAIARALERRLATEPDSVRSLAEAAGGVDRLVSSLRRVLVQLEEDGRPASELAIADSDAAEIEATMDELLRHAHMLIAAPKFEAAARAVLGAWKELDEARLEDAVVALCGVPALGKKSSEVEAFAVFRSSLGGTTNEERGRRLVRAFHARGRFAAFAKLAREIVSEAEAEIESVSRASAALGFSEILRAARKLLCERPDVAEDVSAGIDALLVDEVQDTSRVQSDLLRLLWARPGTREAGVVPSFDAIRKTGLLVVGDRKQSIYGFRGADVGVFAALAVGLAGSKAREALGIPAGVTWEPKEPLADFHALRHNRRSVPAILDFANAFSARRFRPGDPPPELFEIDYVPETEDLLVPPERVGAEPGSPGFTKWLRVSPKGKSSTKIEEALVIAEHIREMVRAGEAAYRDLAVLATTNGMLDAMSFALAQADVPYVVAGKSFFRTREVRDLAAMLALVLDPGDRRAILEVLRGPWASVHDETLLGLVSHEGGLAPPSTWGSPPRPELVHEGDRPLLAAVAEIVLALARTAGRLGPAVILREASTALGFEEVLAALPRGEQRVANVRKLFAIADRHTDARAFRAWLDDATEQELAESEAATFSEEDDAVRLLTVHASKGLDFPVVFVPEIGAALPRTDRGVARVALGSGDTPNLLCLRIADDTGFVLEPPSYTRAHAIARRRERAERQRLAYVAVTRAKRALFLVGGRSKEAKEATDVGASSLAAVDLVTKELPALVSAVDVAVPPPAVRPAAEVAIEAEVSEAPARPIPAWRALPIAPTALADFAHCSRRFELIHLLGIPEFLRGARSSGGEAALTTGLDARAQGTLAHAVLERVSARALGASDAESAASAALVASGVPVSHDAHAAIVARAARFLSSGYASEVTRYDAEVRREVAFVLDVRDTEGRSVVLRGNIDLVVVYPDGSVDVVDYKSARGGEVSEYAFQLDVYALAARERYPNAPRLRVGLVFLGAGSGEPVWRGEIPEDAVRARLAALGAKLVEARWSASFPRVTLDRCEAITCGFIGRCHGSAPKPVEEE